MNGIWTLAEGRPDLFPGVTNPGRQSTVDVVGEITGLDIQQSVVINLRGFKALVDAMGGVDVNVQQKVCVECHTSSSGGIAFTERQGASASSPGSSTSTASTPSGTPARAPAATTSAGCGASGASPVP